MNKIGRSINIKNVTAPEETKKTTGSKDGSKEVFMSYDKIKSPILGKEMDVKYICKKGEDSKGSIKYMGKNTHGIYDVIEEYIGDCKNFEPTFEGQVTYKYQNGDVYIGEFDKSSHQKNGNGKVTHDDGTSFEGKFVNDQKHGIGKMIDKFGFAYNVKYDNGEQIEIPEPTRLSDVNKQNIIRYVSSNDHSRKTYTGTTNCKNINNVSVAVPVNVYANGYGVMTFGDKSFFIGNFAYDKIQENFYGLLTTKEGDAYIGKFEGDDKNGIIMNGIYYKKNNTETYTKCTFINSTLLKEEKEYKLINYKDPYNKIEEQLVNDIRKHHNLLKTVERDNLDKSKFYFG